MAANIYDWSLVAANNSNSDGDLTWAEGQAPSTVNNSARVMMQRGKQLLVDIGGSIAAGGTANGLTVAAASPFTALADGQIISFRATASNTGAATLNVNSIGAKAIRKMDATGDVALVANEIRNTGIYVAQYSAALNGAAGAWLLVNPTPAGLASLGANTFTGIQRWAKGADVASAAALPIITDGNYVHVTGVAAITSIATHAAGTWIALEFDGILTLTHNATTLILPGAVNITTAAGDVAIMVSEGGGNWRCMNYQRATLTAYKPPTQQEILATGTYTKSPGARFAIFEGCGGGGGSGGINGTGPNTAVTAGGGSGFSGSTGIIDVSATVTAAVNIGAAGTAGTSAANGGTGGNTTITIGATTYTWGGGTGSDFRNAGAGVYSMDGGAGGTGTNLTGSSQQGGTGVGSTTDNNVTAGAGGSSAYGTGGLSRHSIAAAAAGGGLSGSGKGAGASGAFNNGVNSNQNGAAGTIGYMRVTEYY